MQAHIHWASPLPAALSGHHQGLPWVQLPLPFTVSDWLVDILQHGQQVGGTAPDSRLGMAPVCLCRYAQDGIYSHAGPVLIAVNPFKSVPLYAPDVVQRYKVMGKPV